MEPELQRPDPDALLAHVQAEDQDRRRGRLKIFLGYAAGVGKTYAMLEAAHQRQAEGVDVVVGYVETHGRVETERMAATIEIIPRRTSTYRGVALTEMDVQAILARRPQLALVDELAHTNVPGSLHPKRYQDVQDLLATGINVYTTLNVQHLESLNDVIAQITGVSVHETVPDRVIDEAAEIELVDLPPDELLQRLEEGKVYVPEQAARAIQKFFRKGNLTALRELALRRAAERVDDQMSGYMRTRAIPGPWPATERLVVCVSPSSSGERLVRSARRLADELNAEWIALYVETPEHVRLSETDRGRVAETLRLAEELGARPVILPGQDVARNIVQFARQQNVTKIIAGKTLRSRWVEALRGSIVDRLIRISGSIDVYVISSERPAGAGPEPRPWQPHRPLLRYVYATLLAGAAIGLSAVLHLVVSPINLVMLYLLAVVVAALYLGRGPSILVSLFTLLAFDFFFVPPYLTFAVLDSGYVLTFAGFLAVGLVISQLTSTVRSQVEMVQRRELNMTILYGLVRDLAAADRLEAVLHAVIANIGQTFGRQVTVFLPEAGKHLKLRTYGAAPGAELAENELAVATWAYQHGEPAGHATQTLPAMAARYLPLKTSRGVVGVLAVRPAEQDARLSPDQVRLLEALAGQAALAIERVQFAERASQAQLLEAAERLQAALLNTISHDLRTPLVAITGALSILQDGTEPLEPATRSNLIENAYLEAQRLNRLVGNLLNMTRLEAGALKVSQQPGDIQDVIGSALEQLGNNLTGRPVNVDISPETPLAPMDFILMLQVFVNVIDNAVKYSPPGTPIDISARQAGAYLEIQVADRGAGIPEGDLTRVFDKFYRVQRPENVGGTGLGLAICKGIMEAHGGFINAENRAGGGTIITIALPLAKKVKDG